MHMHAQAHAHTHAHITLDLTELYCLLLVIANTRRSFMQCWHRLFLVKRPCLSQYTKYTVFI